MQTTRRSYSKLFKAQVIQECAQPAASISSVALSHSLNANLVHKWIRVQTLHSVMLRPAFVPVSMQSATQGSGNISVEILHPHGTVKVNWPTDSAATCAAFLRDLLR